MGRSPTPTGCGWQAKTWPKRVSFLIGLDGKIVHVTDAGNPDTHFNEMKDAIAGLKKK